jgi:hypothetical protein
MIVSDWTMSLNSEWEDCGRKLSWPIWKYYLSTRELRNLSSYLISTWLQHFDSFLLYPLFILLSTAVLFSYLLYQGCPLYCASRLFRSSQPNVKVFVIRIPSCVMLRVWIVDTSCMFCRLILRHSDNVWGDMWHCSVYCPIATVLTRLSTQRCVAKMKSVTVTLTPHKFWTGFIGRMTQNPNWIPNRQDCPVTFDSLCKTWLYGSLGQLEFHSKPLHFSSVLSNGISRSGSSVDFNL